MFRLCVVDQLSHQPLSACFGRGLRGEMESIRDWVGGNIFAEAESEIQHKKVKVSCVCHGDIHSRCSVFCVHISSQHFPWCLALSLCHTCTWHTNAQLNLVWHKSWCAFKWDFMLLDEVDVGVTADSTVQGLMENVKSLHRENKAENVSLLKKQCVPV